MRMPEPLVIIVVHVLISRPRPREPVVDWPFHRRWPIIADGNSADVTPLTTDTFHQVPPVGPAALRSGVSFVTDRVNEAGRLIAVKW